MKLIQIVKQKKDFLQLLRCPIKYDITAQYKKYDQVESCFHTKILKVFYRKDIFTG